MKDSRCIHAGYNIEHIWKNSKIFWKVLGTLSLMGLRKRIRGGSPSNAKNKKGLLPNIILKKDRAIQGAFGQPF